MPDHETCRMLPPKRKEFRQKLRNREVAKRWRTPLMASLKLHFHLESIWKTQVWTNEACETENEAHLFPRERFSRCRCTLIFVYVFLSTQATGFLDSASYQTTTKRGCWYGYLNDWWRKHVSQRLRSLGGWMGEFYMAQLRSMANLHCNSVHRFFRCWSREQHKAEPKFTKKKSVKKKNETKTQKSKSQLKRQSLEGSFPQW
jgi:hypothetical protein